MKPTKPPLTIQPLGEPNPQEGYDVFQDKIKLGYFILDEGEYLFMPYVAMHSFDYTTVLNIASEMEELNSKL